jgi:acetyl esterase/lipase
MTIARVPPRPVAHRMTTVNDRGEIQRDFLTSQLAKRAIQSVCLIIVSILGVAAQASEKAITAFKVNVQSAVVYATVDGVDLLCDVYSPVDTAEIVKPRPVVLLIHGGAWSSGSRLTMGGHAMRLAKAGFVAISIDYRLAPAWKFPTQLDDVRRAIGWACTNGDQFGADTGRMGLFGYSAGGHLACLIGTLSDEPAATIATTTHFPPDDPLVAGLIRPLAICAGGPPCDLTAIPANHGGLSYFLGGTPAEVPQAYWAASPLTHASAGDVPTLFIHGDRDAIVPLTNSEALYTAQQESGVASEFLTIEKQGHMLTFINPKAGDAMVEFFTRRLLNDQ